MSKKKKSFQKNYSFPKCSCWQVQCMFWQPCKIFCKPPQNSPKTEKKHKHLSILSSNNFFVRSSWRHLIEVLTNLLELLSQKSGKLSPVIRYCKFFKFFSKVFSSQSLFCTHAVRFWRSCQKTLFAINHENFRLLSGNELSFFQRKFSHEVFPLACKRQFWQLSRNFYFDFLESFTELPHVKKQGFTKNFSPWNVPLDTKNAVLTTVQKTFAITPKFFRLQSEIQYKMFFFQRKGFPSRQSCGKVEFSTDNTAIKSLRKFTKKWKAKKS